VSTVSTNAEPRLFDLTVEHFLAPVIKHLRDPEVAEILINGPSEIYIEKSGRLERLDARFEDTETLLAAINNILQFAGKRMEAEHPLVDARLPDGSRVHVALPPCSRKGPCLTIRKFSAALFNMRELVRIGSLTDEVAEFLLLCVRIEKNILISGGTSSGKTTLLNALSEAIPQRQRVLVIEETSELQLQQEHALSLETRPPDRYGRGEVTIHDLLRASLQMRPDRLVIGEVRGGEALDMLAAMTSGQGGSMSTLHATTPEDALNRLETMALMSGVNLPLAAVRAQVASAVDLVIQTQRFNDGRRGVTHVSEVLPLKPDGTYGVQHLYGFQVTREAGTGRSSGALSWTGSRPTFFSEPYVRGLGDEVRLTHRLFAPETGRA
jgi:pilus assembly protein CpaF